MDVQTRGRDTFVPALREPPPHVVEIETWRELPGGEIEFTMKRLRSAD
jgi:hypothetical protein